MDYNISNDVREAARRRGFSPTSTGGGLDYMYKELPDGSQLVLESADGVGSPPSLAAACVLIRYDSDDWNVDRLYWKSTHSNVIGALAEVERAEQGQPGNKALISKEVYTSLVGRSIIGLDVVNSPYGERFPILLLSDGAQVIVQSDEEGNGGGALCIVRPRISDEFITLTAEVI